MSVTCGLCGWTWGCDCHEQERLFSVATEPKCSHCNTTDKNACDHDQQIRDGHIKASAKRPKSCLNHYDPTTAPIPF